MYRVSYFFRKREPQFNSIEELFSSVIAALPERIKVERYEVPIAGASIKGIIRNCKFASDHRGSINHITGHINYIASVTGRKTILTVHDIQSSVKGRLLRDLLITLLWFWIPAIRVKCITVVSSFSKKELISVHPLMLPWSRFVIPVKTGIQYFQALLDAGSGPA